MKAGIYYGIKDIRVEEREKPIAGSHDVIVKLVRAGICGTDLTAYLYDGDAVSIFPNNEFGHEMVGRIVEVGDKTTGLNVGDRVFINPTTCKKEGMLKCDMAGAFSEYVCVEDAKLDYNLFKLNDDVAFDEAVVIEPLSVGTHGKNVVKTKNDENVVIYGAGPIGLCTLSSLIATGIKNAVVIDFNDDRLKLVKEMGGTPLNPTKEDRNTFLSKHFGNAYSHLGIEVPNVDVVIDCAGASSILQDYLMTCKKDSRFSVVAVAKDASQIYTSLIMSQEATVRGSCGYTIDDIKEAMDNVNNHKSNVGKIVTHHFTIEQLPEAFEFASNPANKSIKVVIDYE